jgi:phosphotransferase system enzyme I (PtsI)
MCLQILIQRVSRAAQDDSEARIKQEFSILDQENLSRRRAFRYPSHMAERRQKGEIVLRGIAASAGVARAKIVVLEKVRHEVEHRTIADEEIPAEINRLKHALVRTREQVRDVQKKLGESIGANQAGIFEAHLLIIEDPSLVDESVNFIQQHKVNAEHAFNTIGERYASALARVDDEYLRERAADLRDLISRVLHELLGKDRDVDLKHLKEPCIIVAHDLTPSRTAQLDRKNVLGFATDIGSKTSHSAILSRSLRIPAVVGLKTATEDLETGQQALLDGYNGLIIINPTDQTLFEYGQLVRKQISLEEKLREVIEQPAITLDNHTVILSANIEQASDAEAVKAGGAEGVGLFRTEYLFINRDAPPDEEEQFQHYSEAARLLSPRPVVFRTLDLGGDKLLSSLHIPAEMNPFLGWRAIRFCLAQPEIFCAQLRAILRASVHGNVRMMYPMISGVDELDQANVLLDQCKAELRARQQPFDETLGAGAMIEIPSAVIIADALAKRAKFFSVGTNDLIQYALAVDRMNEKIAHLYEPTHPAIIRLLKQTVESAHTAGIKVSVCGEMAGDPVYTPLLLGLGVDELSAAPSFVAQIKFMVRRLKISDCRELVGHALRADSPTEILNQCKTLAVRCAPSLFDSNP